LEEHAVFIIGEGGGGSMAFS